MRSTLLACLHIERWADDVVAAGPFASVDALVAAATVAATPLSEAELAEALAAHPRIGERPSGAGRSSAFSQQEQRASQSADEALAARLAEGNRAYEERFDRVFLIRAAGRSREEIVAALDRRLANDDEAELAEVAAQLREITALRLRQAFTVAEGRVVPQEVAA